MHTYRAFVMTWAVYVWIHRSEAISPLQRYVLLFLYLNYNDGYISIWLSIYTYAHIKCLCPYLGREYTGRRQFHYLFGMLK